MTILRSSLASTKIAENVSFITSSISMVPFPHAGTPKLPSGRVLQQFAISKCTGSERFRGSTDIHEEEARRTIVGSKSLQNSCRSAFRQQLSPQSVLPATTFVLTATSMLTRPDLSSSKESGGSFQPHRRRKTHKPRIEALPRQAYLAAPQLAAAAASPHPG